MASIFKARLVRNFVARTKSVVASSSVMLRCEPSTSERVRQLQDFANSSIKLGKKEKKKKKTYKELESVSPTPKEKENHKTLKENLFPQSTKSLSKKGRLFYDLGEDGEEPPFASEEKPIYLW